MWSSWQWLGRWTEAPLYWYTVMHLHCHDTCNYTFQVASWMTWYQAVIVHGCVCVCVWVSAFACKCHDERPCWSHCGFYSFHVAPEDCIYPYMVKLSHSFLLSKLNLRLHSCVYSPCMGRMILIFHFEIAARDGIHPYLATVSLYSLLLLSLPTKLTFKKGYFCPREGEMGHSVSPS